MNFTDSADFADEQKSPKYKIRKIRFDMTWSEFWGLCRLRCKAFSIEFIVSGMKSFTSSFSAYCCRMALKEFACMPESPKGKSPKVGTGKSVTTLETMRWGSKLSNALCSTLECLATEWLQWAAENLLPQSKNCTRGHFTIQIHILSSSACQLAP